MEHLPIVRVTNVTATLEDLNEPGGVSGFYGLDEAASNRTFGVDYSSPTVLVLAAKEGLHEQCANIAPMLVRLPMAEDFFADCGGGGGGIVE